MNDMRSMLNSAPPVRQYEACCATERDPATVEFQLDRLRVAVTEVRVQTTNALSKLKEMNIECAQEKPAKPFTVYEAVAQLAGELETAVGDLNKLNDIANRQLGNWRLE